ncbi:SGNH/GDSL hydrolase family protein [Streptomyces sp. NBC_00572]|uniref:SGNH/GDSL hydrolase family protein n=1 Tax=Streptomyces sp. NBC_00572 TaxID=2903664 RepID=UPI00225BBEDD|nr:SGNH/GDSL hydrolase family protein [Streptomyces sp. NBC_00572]MCX4979613.1 SGNH/GDSL hydrolase family protein [Streptomyces sp. NBC_00572]
MTPDQASAPVALAISVEPKATAPVPVALATPAAVPAPAPARVPPPRPRPRPGTTGTVRFVVLGDSLSEGVGDRVDGTWRGWAPLLADGLAAEGQETAFLNLAVSGALSGDVADRQAPQALAFRPHLASVVVGVNDTLRRTFDIGALARRLGRVCADLDAAGAVLLTACLPDPGRMLGLPAPLARPLARRQRSVNAVVHALSARYGAVHLHLADDSWTEDRTLWSADRLHPGERGHRAVAEGFHRLLADRCLAHGAPPAREPGLPPPSRAETVLWLATAGTGWLLRRSHDLLPQLLLLAGAELRHWADGTGPAPLDARADAALAAALTATMGR